MTAVASTAVEWHRGPMLGFDLETTGVDVETDRIVTASLVSISPTEPGRAPDVYTVTHLVNPGVPIPEAATAIHGITNEHVQAEGRPPTEVLGTLLSAIMTAGQTGTPIVGMNLAYDITLLDRELRRHNKGGLIGVSPVVDVRVLDKAVDPYRSGGRKLTDLCDHYGVRIDGAHDSAFDAIAACRVAWRLAARYPGLLQVDLHTLHERQISWAAEQTASFAAYRRRINQPLDSEDGSWPLRPWRSA